MPYNPEGAELEQNKEPNQVTRFARTVGVVFLTVGLGVATLLLITFLQYTSDPESVYAIGLFAEFLNSDTAVVTVFVQGQEAIVAIDSTLRLILVVFVGAISILALGSILHAFIGSGLALIKFAQKRSAPAGKS